MISITRYKSLIYIFGLTMGLSACTVGHTPQPVLPARDMVTAGESASVQGNQNIYAFARAHNVSMREIIVLNNLHPPFAIKAGQHLILPAGGATFGGDTKSLSPLPQSAPSSAVEKLELAPLVPVSAQPVNTPAKPAAAPVDVHNQPSVTQKFSEANDKPSQEMNVAPAQPAPLTPTVSVASGVALAAPVLMAWPVQGPIISAFGDKGQGLVNDGINIAAPKGSPVVASMGGTVVYAGNEMKGFGNLILIRHQKGWVTAYAHLDRMLVTKDSIVAQGDMIATVGKTGKVSTPQLHFETRHDGKPVDPHSLMKT